MRSLACALFFTGEEAAWLSFSFLLALQLYMDGGASDNLPTGFEGETITVSPFSGQADICPADSKDGWDVSFDWNGTNIRMNWSNAFRLKSALFPPDSASLERSYQRGYQDCVQFLQKRGVCLPLATVIHVHVWDQFLV